MPRTDVTSLERRKPVQGRSRERRQVILDAARELVLERGSTEGITTRTLAERARVPIGSVYYLFPHVNAVFYALLSGDLKELRVTGSGSESQGTNRPSQVGSAQAGPSQNFSEGWAIDLDDTIEALALFLEKRPLIRLLTRALRNDPEFEAINDADNERWRQGNERWIGDLLPMLSEVRHTMIARVIVRISETLLHEMGLHEQRSDRRLVIEELKLNLKAYVQAHLQQATSQSASQKVSD